MLRVSSHIEQNFDPVTVHLGFVQRGDSLIVGKLAENRDKLGEIRS